MTYTTPISAPKWTWFVIAGIIGAYLALAYVLPPGQDTLWRLHIARGLLDGQTLYRDMVEVNPPLWFWGAMPAAAMGGYPALVFINLLMSLVGAALFAKLARLSLTPPEVGAATLSLLAGLLLVSVAEIGQREQAFLLACALWSAMAAARIENKSISPLLAIIATCLCAYGFALKHYFILAPLVIEALVLWRTKRSWRPLRPETITLAILAVLYGVAVVYLTPDFLGRVLGLVQAAYFGFGPWNNVGLFERYLGLLLQVAFVFIPIMAWVLTRQNSTLVTVLLAALAASLIAILLQQKGWRYHIIAANGLSLMIVATVWRDGISPFAKRFVPLGLAALGWTGIVSPAISSMRSNGQPMSPILANILANEPSSSHIAVLSTAPDNAFYPAARAGKAHWSRHFSMWMMPGLLTPQSAASKETLRLFQRARVLEDFTSDLICKPPDLIVGEVGYFRNPNPQLFDAMAFLREDKAFSAWMDSYYVKQPNIGDYPIWRLKGAKPPLANCTRATQ